MATITVTSGTETKATACSYTKTGYEFAGWDSAYNHYATYGTAGSYADKADLSGLGAGDGATVRLYAQWKPIEYVVQYDGNKPAGATATVAGVPANGTATYDGVNTLNTANIPTLGGYTFTGWRTASTSTSGSSEYRFTPASGESGQEGYVPASFSPTTISKADLAGVSKGTDNKYTLVLYAIWQANE